MPRAKRTTPKTAKTTKRRPAKKATKRPAQPRTMSAAHKKALAEGRTMSATVDRYLAAVNTPKQRGRKVTKATLEQRLAAARTRVKTASGVEKVVTAQEVRDLQQRLARLNTTGHTDVKSLEVAFVRIAKQFGENRGIGYGAWRDAGVPAAVLKKAGVARTRG